MIGIVFAVMARIQSRHISVELEAFQAGARHHEVKDDPEKLQELIDSLSSVYAEAVHNVLARDPDASAFSKVKWPTFPRT